MKMKFRGFINFIDENRTGLIGAALMLFGFFVIKNLENYLVIFINDIPLEKLRYISVGLGFLIISMAFLLMILRKESLFPVTIKGNLWMVDEDFIENSSLGTRIR